ncbi:MAG: hypothetical protein NC489_08070 [Ruminococcus flavefaciens]|nr:hypothetical protein [Ruminococcus flavefaciens]
MLESRVQAIDTFYHKFMDMRPEDVRADLDCPYVYIHRLESGKSVGIHAQVRHRDPTRLSDSYFGYPKLETWLLNSYHPQLHLKAVHLQNGSNMLSGYVELFKTPLSISPGTFSEPDSSLNEVYHCAAAFTYELMYSNKGPAISEINQIIQARLKHCTNLNDITDEATSIIDRKLTSQYKSLTKAVQELRMYIQTKV